MVAGGPGLKVDTEALPWAVRLVVQLQDARELLAEGDASRAAGRAADIVVLADSSKLGRDAVEARLLVADALMALGEPAQAQAVLPVGAAPGRSRSPCRCARRTPSTGWRRSPPSRARRHTGPSPGLPQALRVSRRAVGRERPGVRVCRGVADGLPRRVAVERGQLTAAGVAAVAGLLASQELGGAGADPVAGADQGRARRRRARRRGADQPPDRRAAVRVTAHGRRPPQSTSSASSRSPRVPSSPR